MQRPLKPEEFLLGSTLRGECAFVLFSELPVAEPFAAEGQDRIDGLHFVTATMDEVARFVALRHLRVPRDRCLPLVTRATVDITDAEPWRLGGPRGQVVTDLHFRSVGGPGMPDGLECTGRVSVDGEPCATARAHLSFPEPAPPRSAARPRLLAEDLRRVRPERVGCGEGRDVVVHGSLVIDEHRVLMDVVPHPGNPVFDPGRSGRAGAVLLIEASRQAATLAAGELRGLSTAHCLLTRWSAEFRGSLDNGAPLRCSAVPGALTRDTRDRPVVPVRIEFTQDERCVGTVDVVVLQDC
ncbi:AfsA-related hotdog domain-containing protein [Streptomyces sp. NPDC051569]|uniref:AfsA-related hotdog domain-containing protein n=1 Tax=Streptomyces sp. NPDC051569 TaxID=3365661 RepID=UPI003797B0B0